LFKSLDLIPDGLEDLGFSDDAFVLARSPPAVSEANATRAACSASSPPTPR